ncbi:MAG: two-component system, OmpR family, response regulator VicR [Thermodesulfobacteriota bacterium]|nr:two-component system, OmpR family, response regulator VicR [Thermodesulfobacteriota bacterium]
MMENKKILIVDDESPILRLLSQVFTKAGYEVFTAESGRDALKIIEENNIMVMFFDLNMPVMNGMELCKSVKSIKPMSIIYAITGYASLFELSECLDVGFEDYFKKPVNVSTLLKTAESAFEKVNRWKKM